MTGDDKYVSFHTTLDYLQSCGKCSLANVAILSSCRLTQGSDTSGSPDKLPWAWETEPCNPRLLKALICLTWEALGATGQLPNEIIHLWFKLRFRHIYLRLTGNQSPTLKCWYIFDSDRGIPFPTCYLVLLNHWYGLCVSVQPGENTPEPGLVVFCTTLGLSPWEPRNPSQLPGKKHWSSQAASCECMWVGL